MTQPSPALRPLKYLRVSHIHVIVEKITHWTFTLPQPEDPEIKHTIAIFVEGRDHAIATAVGPDAVALQQTLETLFAP